MNKKKADTGIVEETQRAAFEVDSQKRQQGVQEGVEAGKKIAEIQSKEEKRLKDIGDKYLNGIPYETERVIGETQAFFQQSVTGIIEVGKRLLAMKEAEKYGVWERIVEEKIGISRMTAWRFMAVAKKMGSCNTVLQLNAPNKGGTGKLYALLNIPDEDLHEFDETGVLKGATIEDINKMSAKEFKRLIAEKEDWKAKAKQYEELAQSKYDTQKQYKEKLAVKDKEISQLKAQLDDQGIPEGDKEALKKIETLKIQLRGIIRIIESANLKGHNEEVKEDLLLLAQYAHDRGELCLGRVLELTKGPAHTPDREYAEEEYKKVWEED